MPLAVSDVLALIEGTHNRVQLVSRNKSQLRALALTLQRLLLTLRDARVDSDVQSAAAFNDALTEIEGVVLKLDSFAQKEIQRGIVSRVLGTTSVQDELRLMQANIDNCCNQLQIQGLALGQKQFINQMQLLKAQNKKMDELLRRTGTKPAVKSSEANPPFLSPSSEVVGESSQAAQASVATSVMSAIEENTEYGMKCRYANGMVSVLSCDRSIRPTRFSAKDALAETVVRVDENTHTVLATPSRLGREVSVLFHLDGRSIRREYVGTGICDIMTFRDSDRGAEETAQAWYHLLLKIHRHDFAAVNFPSAIVDVMKICKIESSVQESVLCYRREHWTKPERKWETPYIDYCDPDDGRDVMIRYSTTEDTQRWRHIKLLDSVVVSVGGFKGKKPLYREVIRYETDDSASLAYWTEVANIRSRIQEQPLKDTLDQEHEEPAEDPYATSDLPRATVETANDLPSTQPTSQNVAPPRSRSASPAVNDIDFTQRMRPDHRPWLGNGERSSSEFSPMPETVGRTHKAGSSTLVTGRTPSERIDHWRLKVYEHAESTDVML